MHLQENLFCGSFFSVYLQVYPCNFKKSRLNLKVFPHEFCKLTLFKIFLNLLRDIFAIPFLTKMQLY